MAKEEALQSEPHLAKIPHVLIFLPRQFTMPYDGPYSCEETGHNTNEWPVWPF